MDGATARQVQVVHALPGRLRVRLEIPPEVARRSVEAAVLTAPGVRRARFSPYTSNILIEYDPTMLASDALLLHLQQRLRVLGDGEEAASAPDPVMVHAASLSSAVSRVPTSQAPSARIIPFPGHRARGRATLVPDAGPLAQSTVHLAAHRPVRNTATGASQRGWLPSILIAMDESPLLPLLLRALLGRRRATLISQGIGFVRLVVDHRTRLGTTLQALGTLSETILE